MRQQQKTKRQQKRLTLVDLIAMALLRKKPSESIELQFHSLAFHNVKMKLNGHFSKVGEVTGKEKDRLKVKYYHHKRMIEMFE